MLSKTMGPVLRKERTNWEEVQEGSLNEPLLWGEWRALAWGALEKELGGLFSHPWEHTDAFSCCWKGLG